MSPSLSERSVVGPADWVSALGLAAWYAGAGQTEQARELLDEAYRIGGDAARAEARNWSGLDLFF